MLIVIMNWALNTLVTWNKCYNNIHIDNIIMLLTLAWISAVHNSHCLISIYLEENISIQLYACNFI